MCYPYLIGIAGYFENYKGVNKIDGEILLRGVFLTLPLLNLVEAIVGFASFLYVVGWK